MNHPTDALLDLVDGTSSGPERDEVLAHVRGCARCRAEVEAAIAGRGAMRSLGAPPVPAGLGDAAVEAARAEAAERAPEVRPLRTGGRGAGRPPRWYRAAAGAAIAAAVLTVVAVALPRVGGDDALTTEAEDTTMGAEAAASFQRSDQDFAVADVQALADSAAGGTTVPGAAAVSGPALEATDVAPDRALACLDGALQRFPGVRLQVIEATFEGEPAYLAVLASGPGADQPADEITVYVVIREGCRLAHSTRSVVPE
jgi:anti-sigma factor RsiW